MCECLRQKIGQDLRSHCAPREVINEETSSSGKWLLIIKRTLASRLMDKDSHQQQETNKADELFYFHGTLEQISSPFFPSTLGLEMIHQMRSCLWIQEVYASLSVSGNV